MPRPTSYVRVRSLKEMMACHVDVIQLCVLPKGDDTIAITNVVPTCVRSKGYDVMRQCMLFKGDDGMPRPMLSYPVYVVQW